MVFGRNLCEQRQIWLSEPHFGKVRGDARPCLMARWKPMVDFLFVLTELFSLSITVSEFMRGNGTARLFFTGGRSLCTPNFTWTGSSPINRWGQIRNSIYSSRRAIKITSYNDRHIALSNEVKVPMNRKSHFVTGKNTLALE